MESKKLKTAVDKDIWVIPTGNAVTRGVPIEKQIKKVLLEKVGTKTYTIKGEGYFSGTYPIDGTYNKYNSGYMPFLTEQDAKNYFKKVEIAKKIKYDINLEALDYEELMKIWAIIKKEPELKNEESNQIGIN